LGKFPVLSLLVPRCRESTAPSLKRGKRAREENCSFPFRSDTARVHPTGRRWPWPAAYTASPPLLCPLPTTSRTESGGRAPYRAPDGHLPPARAGVDLAGAAVEEHRSDLLHPASTRLSLQSTPDGLSSSPRSEAAGWAPPSVPAAGHSLRPAPPPLPCCPTSTPPSPACS
ncbi:hypothetical protein BRADI_1g34413v3, partial [Brachypodium distachyon]